MVYSAVHDDGVRRVAIKILHPDVAATFGEDLLRWGKRAAQIRHARIANILGANRLEDGTTAVRRYRAGNDPAFHERSSCRKIRAGTARGYPCGPLHEAGSL